MSLFGKLDAANIPTNPFFVEQGEYTAEVTDAKYKTNRNDVRQLVIQYTITSENSQFLDSRVTDYFDLVAADLTAEQFILLPAEEQKKIRRNNANLKRRLCGNDNNDKQKGLGIPQDDLNDENWDPAVLVGLKVSLAVSNYGANNEGVNIKWVNIIED